MSSSELQQNREALKELMHRAAVRPKHENGQNFLIDSDAVEALVDAAEVQKGDTVLEIGPGFGAVTGLLLERGASVVAVELDRRLAVALKKRFGDDPSFRLIEGNILDIRMDELFEEGMYKLVSSLPFNITSIVLRRFLENSPRPSVIALIIQREVAQRVVAKPGDMSILSASVQYLGEPSFVREVPRSSFWPIPEVDAAVLKVQVKKMPEKSQQKAFFRLLHIGFSARRKMLHNNLSSGLHQSSDEVKKLLSENGLNPLCRAQDLSVKDWLTLAK